MFIKADINKYYIFANRLDAAEGDDIYEFSAKEATELSRTGNDNRINTAIRRLKVNINNTAKNTAVILIDNLFAFKVEQFHRRPP